MKNFLLFISPFLVTGLFLGVALIFGGDALLAVLTISLVIMFLSLFGQLLVDCFGD